MQLSELITQPSHNCGHILDSIFAPEVSKDIAVRNIRIIDQAISDHFSILFQNYK